MLLTIWYFVLLAAYQPVTAFNGHLPTSTPALSPQQAVNPPVVHPVSSTLHLLKVNCQICISLFYPKHIAKSKILK